MTRSLDAYLHTADPLARLRAQAERLIRLQRVFTDIAPASLRDACRVANYKSGKVVIHADNGAVAAKLKQSVPTLVDEFCKRGCEVTEIAVKVQPPPERAPQEKLRTAASVSTCTKGKLRDLADALPAESPVAAALRRLVQRSS